MNKNNNPYLFYKKAIYQELIKVRYMRPLETLHNNLCFKTLNAFLTRMVNDRQSPHESIALSKTPFSKLESFISNEETLEVFAKLENKKSNES